MDLACLYAHQIRTRRSLPRTTPAMSHTAFFYGTLMAPPVLHRVIWGSQTPPTPAHASLLSIRPAILHAHQRRHVKNADYPAVIPAAPASEVRGTLVRGLTDGDMWRLDIFEGDEYERRDVKVRLLLSKRRVGHPAHQDIEGHPAHQGIDGDPAHQGIDGDPAHQDMEGEEVPAQTYIWTAGEHRLESEEWDFDHFVKEKMSRWVGDDAADAGFQDVDDAVAALQDPTGGRGANGEITKQLESGGTAEEQVLKRAV
ncbi:AIG2-like family protein [Stagonosporopsis vannaccii]|nr:AIG2-like family protein [Stagonosporopsis vannaccii]